MNEKIGIAREQRRQEQREWSVEGVAWTLRPDARFRRYDLEYRT